MPDFQDRTYLTTDQYKDASNLTARILLHQRYSTNPYGWFLWMFDQLDLSPGADILEIGCGSGSLWADNLPRIPAGWHLVLSDFSPGMVHACQLKLASRPDVFTCEVSDAAAIPFPAETFDAVIANHILYHLSDRPRALSEIARVLKPAGCIYAATNGENHLLELDAIIEKSVLDGNTGLLRGKPSRYFTLENGAAQIAPWFKEIDIRCYQDSLRVTEVEPLLAYIVSMVPLEKSQVDITRDTSIYHTLHAQIEQQGYIHIQKSAGLFIGWK